MLTHRPIGYNYCIAYATVSLLKLLWQVPTTALLTPTIARTAERVSTLASTAPTARAIHAGLANSAN